MDGEFVCAGRFTMADVSVGYAVLLAQTIGLVEFVTPGMAAYLARLRLRDGFKRAIAAES